MQIYVQKGNSYAMNLR